jgi:hypothetical protein
MWGCLGYLQFSESIGSRARMHDDRHTAGQHNAAPVALARVVNDRLDSVMGPAFSVLHVIGVLGCGKLAAAYIFGIQT